MKLVYVVSEDEKGWILERESLLFYYFRLRKETLDSLSFMINSIY
jgi:hypothetical protein